MASGNMAILLADEQGVFIRVGTSKYRPPASVTGLRKGQAVKAWSWDGGLKVEHNKGPGVVWPKG